jgi:hypothetical protein
MKSILFFLLFITSITTIFAQLPNRDWDFAVYDNFNPVVTSNETNDYGLNIENKYRTLVLNGNLPNTQLPQWTRTNGTWYEKNTNLPWLSQVNHPSFRNSLSFHTAYSAVKYGKPIDAGIKNVYRIAFRTNPVVNDTASECWTSVMLNADPNNRGFVAHADFGFSIASNGNFQTMQFGQTIIAGKANAAAMYEVVLDINTDNKITVTINNITFSAAILVKPLPSKTYLYLGAFIPPNSSQVSIFDDILVNTLSATETHLEKFGYYYSYFQDGNQYDSPIIDNLPKILDYTNFNWVEPGRLDMLKTYQSQNKKLVVDFFWYFFEGDNATGFFKPRTDWLDQWTNTLKPKVDSIKSSIAAFYMFDEIHNRLFMWYEKHPDVYIAYMNIYAEMIKKVKTDCPDLDIVGIEAFTSLDIRNAPMYNSYINFAQNNALDYTGVDKYLDTSPAFYPSSATNENDFISPILDRMIQMNPGKKIMVIPPSYFTEKGRRFTQDNYYKHNGKWSDDNAKLLDLNWSFYKYSTGQFAVKAIANFGCFSKTDSGNVFNEDPFNNTPMLIEMHQLIGNSILHY